MKIKWNARAFPAKQKPVMHSGFALENNLYLLKNGKSFKLQPVFYRNFIHRIKPLPNTQKLPDGTRDGNNMQCALSKQQKLLSPVHLSHNLTIRPRVKHYALLLYFPPIKRLIFWNISLFIDL